MGARREADAAIMAVTVSTGPAAVPDDGELADAAAIRESLGQPERFAVLYDRPAELVALFGALKRLPRQRGAARGQHRLVDRAGQLP